MRLESNLTSNCLKTVSAHFKDPSSLEAPPRGKFYLIKFTKISRKGYLS